MRWTVTVGALALSATTACHRERSPRDAEAGALTVVDPHAAPAREVVSLVPSATEVLFALGAGDRVVGVSAYDGFPPEVTRLPRVGGMANRASRPSSRCAPTRWWACRAMNVGVLQRLHDMGVRALFRGPRAWARCSTPSTPSGRWWERATRPARSDRGSRPTSPRCARGWRGSRGRRRSRCSACGR
ncbi:MAG: hypothetical protein R3A52_28435 [Polyangiales bacterium]